MGAALRSVLRLIEPASLREEMLERASYPGSRDGEEEIPRRMYDQNT